MTAASPDAQPPAVHPAPPGQPQPFGFRLAMGLTGIFIASMMAGLNNRVGSLALADVRGALGFGLDDASWLNTVYIAGELVAMPFATWFAFTFSLRRFQLAAVGATMALAVLLPFVHNLTLLLILRSLQGVTAGILIPLLMMSALRFLPPPIRLHGLALYAMTATFSPNLAIWFTALWTDHLFDLRLIYWQIIPIGFISAVLVAWGIPQDPLHFERLKEGNWTGFVIGAAGLVLSAVALDQGTRLDWFNSPLICWSLAAGIGLVAIYLMTEWHHPAPFIKLQLLERRNLWAGFVIFVCLLIAMQASSLLPVQYLSQVQGYRALQNAPLGLIVGLPQLVLGPAVALLLYRKWVDARIVLSLGLCLIACTCLLSAKLTSSWNGEQFVHIQILFALGLPMAIVPQLFLGTAIVVPSEGAYVSGTVNTLRVLGILLGGAITGQLLSVRARFHTEMLLDRLGGATGTTAVSDAVRLFGEIGHQASVLATADTYRVLGWLTLALIPLALYLHYVPAPDIDSHFSRKTTALAGTPS